MYTGTENNAISCQDAATLTANYRNSQSGEYVKGEYFSMDSINAILNQDNCVGIRVYYGIDSNNTQRLVIVGVTADESDMVTGAIMEHGSMCPPYCGTANNLNS